MKRIPIVIILCLFGTASFGQTGHPFLKSINIFQQEDLVVLRWVIHGGNTCQGMKIYRGEDQIEFAQIGHISGICGSTDSDETYQFADSTAIENVHNYYRVEFGVQGFSDPVGVFFKQFGDDDLLVLPDPINDKARILFDNEEMSQAVLQVVDRNGVVFYDLSTNTEEFNVDMIGWKDGLYYFQVVLNSEKKTGKLFKF